MGLAPYGRPIYADRIKEKLLKIYDDGSIFLNMDYFSFCTSMQMTSEKFHQLFEGEPRTSESEITVREMNLAASIQAVTEEIVLKMAQHAKKLTGKNKLVMAGGVALNCVANGKLQKSEIFDDIFIAPASGDAGGALGAAYYIWHEIEGNKRLSDEKNDKQFGSLLGPAYSDDEIKEFLHANEIPYHYSEGDTVYATAAAELAAEKVIGWFHGRMEFGPRALGGRSIIGDARSPKMQEIMNLKIKYRESFRPFAPSVLQERSSEYFDLQCESPYMLMVAQVQQEKLLELSKEQTEILENDKDLCKRVNLPRSVVPAITHVDNSARVQTVNEKQSPDYYKLLKNFESITGSPVIINTSFNIRGEPIVCTPEDAFRCFMNTEMDVLVLESCVLYKSEMPKEKKDVENYKSNFALD